MLKDRLVRWFSRTNPDRGTHKIPESSVALTSDIGLVRNENQDRVALMRTTTQTAKPFAAIALVDGMGGMSKGSECAIQAISAFFYGLSFFREKPPEERLRLAVDNANMETHKLSIGKGGATLSALFATPGDDALILNVGDSRIYATVNDKKNTTVKRLTVDDSLEEAVGGHGKELLQFIGMGEGLMPHIEIVPKNARRILITSDGIHFINQECLQEILLRSIDSIEISELLYTFSRFRGSPDNASLAVCDLNEFIKFIPNCEESGVELWDPFGALHIMWSKQDSSPCNELNFSNNNIKNKNISNKKKKLEKTPKNINVIQKDLPEFTFSTSPVLTKDDKNDIDSSK